MKPATQQRASNATVPLSTDKRREEVRRLHESEMTLGEIAARLGVSKSTVHGDVSALGLPRRARGGAGHRVSSEQAANLATRRKRVAALYAELGSARQVAHAVGCSQSTVLDDLEALGIEKRSSGGTAKYERPQPRQCANPACDVVFTPEFPSDAIGTWGRFCSAECRVAGLRKHAPAATRECASCGKPFAPSAAALARGGGRGTYCSRECRKTGAFITCELCGTEVYRPASRLNERFCSRRCWGLFSWDRTLRENFVLSLWNRGLLRGLLASIHIGRVNARKEPTGGAKRRRPPFWEAWEKSVVVGDGKFDSRFPAARFDDLFPAPEGWPRDLGRPARVLHRALVRVEAGGPGASIRSVQTLGLTFTEARALKDVKRRAEARAWLKALRCEENPPHPVT